MNEYALPILFDNLTIHNNNGNKTYTEIGLSYYLVVCAEKLKLEDCFDYCEYVINLWENAVKNGILYSDYKYENFMKFNNKIYCIDTSCTSFNKYKNDTKHRFVRSIKTHDISNRMYELNKTIEELDSDECLIYLIGINLFVAIYTFYKKIDKKNDI